MSEPPTTLASDWAAPPPPRKSFSVVVTVLCSIVVILYIGLLGRPLIEPGISPLAELKYPERSLERLVTRELDLRAAMLHSGLPWEWRLYRALSGDEDPLVEAATWYAELLELHDSPKAELERVILLAESGRTRAARTEIERWSEAGDARARMLAWVTAAYRSPPPSPNAGRTLIREIEDELRPSWFSNTLVRRIATRIGDAPQRAQAEQAILTRGQALLIRARLLTATSAGLLVLGAVALWWMLARRSGPQVGNAPLPPDWSGADGYALFVRSLGVPQAIAVLAFVVLRRETGLGSLLGMAADLPIFLWVWHYLRTHDSSMRTAFGLRPRRRGWAPLAGATFALVAIALVGDIVIQIASGYLRVRTHWTDGFAEELLWAAPRRVLLEAFDASLWAPIVEEITFRGLLYGTLRTRLGAGTSALLSAVIFTLPHGYAAVGSASVLVSGLLWALAYERTRSLLPGLFAHAANNLLSTVWTVALLR